jgi:hypothetical protein
MAQIAMATFTKNGHGVRLSEITILSPSGCFIEEHRYVVYSKTPGKPIDSALYTGPDAEDKARAKYAAEQSRIERNH